MKKLFSALALAALLVPGNACAADFEYNFQSAYAGPHILNTAMYLPGIEELKTESNGRLMLHYFQSGNIVKTDESLNALVNGTVDFGGCGPQYNDVWFPHTLSFIVPHIAKDSVQASALYWKAYSTIPEVKAEWDKHIKLLTLWGSDRSGFFSIKGPILSPADMQGKRVLIWSGGQVDQVKAWGGTPVQITSNDTYIALQRGMGDVFYGPLPVGVAYKLLEIAKDITIIPGNTIFIVLGANWDAWNELPKDLQDMIEAKFGGEAASIKSGRLLYDATNRDLDTMRAAGCTIHTLTAEQYQVFKDADHDVSTAFWLNDLKRIGNPDPAAAIKRAYDMAAATPGAE